MNNAGIAAAFDELSVRAGKHLAQFEHDPLVHPSLAVSIPEIGSDRMLARVASLCTESGRVFQTHANEHLVAVERSLVARSARWRPWRSYAAQYLWTTLEHPVNHWPPQEVA